MPEHAFLRFGAALIATLLLCAGGASAANLAALHPDGHWLKDGYGRVVIIHGLQVAHKTAPYYPPPAGFTSADGQNLQDWGFNAVRLAWLWAGLEPTRGQFDSAYVNQFVRDGQILAGHHVYTLLESHQDLYGPALGGDGFPAWATITDGVPVPPHSALDPEAPDENRAFDNLYANRSGIGDEFARAWRVMANAFRDNPRMLGYDLFNEPYPGSHDATCMQPLGCPAFDRVSLQPLENRLAADVRASDGRTIVFYEPHIYFDFGVQSWLGPPPASAGAAGFAFHDYCLAPIFAGQPDAESGSPGYQSCSYEDEHTMQNAASASAAMGVPALFDEFGDTQDLSNIERMVQLADSHQLGWLYWSYKDWIDAPGGVGSGALFDNSDNNATLRRAKLAVLSEPYPQATAGRPEHYGFDPSTGVFSFAYVPDPSIHAPTVVYVPPIHYPAGYSVTVSGAHVVSAQGARLLRLATDPGAREVQVAVRPA
ncbi:MAG: cellulase family glycosylhydrolase [Solirubrobacteraceae bacterium]